MGLALAMGIISHVFYKDTKAIKKSFGWLISRVIGGENEESYRETKNFKKEKSGKGNKLERMEIMEEKRGAREG